MSNNKGVFPRSADDLKAVKAIVAPIPLMAKNEREWQMATRRRDGAIQLQPMTAAIQVEHVGKRYGESVVLDDVSVEIGKGSSSPSSDRPAPARRRCCASSPA